MKALTSLLRTPDRRIVGIAALIVFLDQLTKALVLKFLGYEEERVIVEGFFKFVHWGNTGAAWSMFKGNNILLAVIAGLALIILYFTRRHFDSRTLLGQMAFGLIVGGIIGNLIDRLLWGHVIDFLYFYAHIAGKFRDFPAFNIADTAICTGVGLVFILTWRTERHPKTVEASAPKPEATDS
jgi:signal peptidase II